MGDIAFRRGGDELGTSADKSLKLPDHGDVAPPVIEFLLKVEIETVEDDIVEGTGGCVSSLLRPERLPDEASEFDTPRLRAHSVVAGGRVRPNTTDRDEDLLASALAVLDTLLDEAALAEIPILNFIWVLERRPIAILPEVGRGVVHSRRIMLRRGGDEGEVDIVEAIGVTVFLEGVRLGVVKVRWFLAEIHHDLSSESWAGDSQQESLADMHDVKTRN